MASAEQEVGDASWLVSRASLMGAGLWGSAQLTLQGAQLVSWRPAGDEVLYSSALTSPEPGTPIRGGIPICLPWFGPHARLGSAAMHGHARLREWRLIDSVEQKSHWALSLGLSHEPDDIWPDPYHAEAHFDIGADLAMRVTLTHLGERPRQYAIGFHSYFAVRDIAVIRIDGLDSVPFVHVGSDDGGAVVSRLPFDGRLVDRLYRGTGAMVLRDGAVRTRIESDSGQRILWNPGRARSAELPDLPSDGWTSFVCLEVGHLYDGAPTLEPGAHVTLPMRVSRQR